MRGTPKGKESVLFCVLFGCRGERGGTVETNTKNVQIVNKLSENLGTNCWCLWGKLCFSGTSWGGPGRLKVRGQNRRHYTRTHR